MSNNTCGAPQDYTPNDACEVAIGLINAHLAMLSGSSVVRVVISGRETSYQKFDKDSAKNLRNEAIRWCRMCQQRDPAKATALGLDQYIIENKRTASFTIPSRIRPFGPHC